MKTALFDTNILIDYLKGKQEAVALFERFLKDGSMLTISLITRVEMISGIRPGEEEILKDVLDAFGWVG
jgi:predicted nucleic acid-binding protein